MLKKYNLAIAVALILLVGGFFALNGYEKLETLLASSFTSNEIVLGKVVSIQEETKEINDRPYWIQTIQIRFLTGDMREQMTEVREQGEVNSDFSQKIQTGETVVLSKNIDFQGDGYLITDKYRLPALLLIALIFIIAVIILGGKRGLSSLLGLAMSIAILLLFVAPKILQGHDPLFITFIGAVAIAISSLYLAHGFSKRTTIAVIGTLITLIIAIGITLAFTGATNLMGLGSEQSFYLKLNVGTLSLHGLLLGSMIIGMLGVLDDVTIGQTAAIHELKIANPKLNFKKLYDHGISIGREHIASLVNTLFLAYAGGALPLLLMLIFQSDRIPLWLVVNGEPIAEEIVRTLVGSLSLVFAVPITTFLAAHYYGKTEAIETNKPHQN